MNNTEKYKELHEYLQAYCGKYRVTYSLSDNAVSILAQRFELSKADLKAGIIQFCNKTGMLFEFEQASFM